MEIFDPAFFPRPKICGEFLNPQAVDWLKKRKLLEPLLAMNPYPIHGMKLTDRQGRSFTGHYLQNTMGYAVMRKDFDSLLVRIARESGIRIYEGCRVEQLMFSGDRAVGVTGKAPNGLDFVESGFIVIGADGRNNLIGRTFGWLKDIPWLRKYTFQAYFENVPELSHFGEIHLVKDGYLGIAPLSDTLANIALVIDESAFPGSDTDRKAFLLHRIQDSHLAGRFQGLIPQTEVMSAGPLAFQTKRVSGHGTLLVGDTCGFIDPFTGEGINYAFLSADLASDVLDSAFKQNSFDDSVLADYDRRRKELFKRKYQLSQLLQKAVLRPELSSMLIRKFGSDLRLGDRMVSAVGSVISMEEVWNLRFLLKLVFA